MEQGRHGGKVQLELPLSPLLIQQSNICLPPDFCWAIMFHVSQLKYYIKMHALRGALHLGEDVLQERGKEKEVKKQNRHCVSK